MCGYLCNEAPGIADDNVSDYPGPDQDEEPGYLTLATSTTTTTTTTPCEAMIQTLMGEQHHASIFSLGIREISPPYGIKHLNSSFWTIPTTEQAKCNRCVEPNFPSYPTRVTRTYEITTWYGKQNMTHFHLPVTGWTLQPWGHNVTDFRWSWLTGCHTPSHLRIQKPPTWGEPMQTHVAFHRSQIIPKHGQPYFIQTRPYI